MILNNGLNINNNSGGFNANNTGGFVDVVSDIFNTVFGKVNLPELKVDVTLPENTVNLGLTPTVILIILAVVGFVLVKN